MATTAMLERKFQVRLKGRIKELLPGSIVLKNDPTFLQGIPDLLVLYRDRWAGLEVKASADAPYRPNQCYYLARMDAMSFCRTIHPENQDEILEELELFLKGDLANEV